MGLLDNFRKNSGQSLKDKIIESQSKSRQNDPNIYYPVRDADKKANVIIRFLPQKNPNEIPFIKLMKHAFKGDNDKWVIEDFCPQSFGKDCPLCQMQRMLWATGRQEYQDLYRTRKATKRYVSNVLVIKDPMSPEKEGQVFVYNFGPEIYNILMNAIKPEFDTDQSINPFDIFEGADFNLRINVDPKKRMITYAQSCFRPASPLCNGNEAQIENVLSRLFDLNEMYNLNKCNSYANLAQKAIDAYTYSFPEGVAELKKRISPDLSNADLGTEMPISQAKPRPDVTKTNNNVFPSESSSDLDEFRNLINDDDEGDEVPF